MIDLKQTLLKVKSKTTVDVKYSRKEHSARVSSLLRVYEQYERQLEGQVIDSCLMELSRTFQERLQH